MHLLNTVNTTEHNDAFHLAVEAYSEKFFCLYFSKVFPSYLQTCKYNFQKLAHDCIFLLNEFISPSWSLPPHLAALSN